jgi:uncharacterized protein (DUF305 family)
MTRSGHALPALVAVCVLGACGGSGASGPSPAGTPTPAELEALYLARQDSARTRFTAADASFVMGMIGHHAQAIDMASLVPSRTTTAAIRTLAGRIINAQQDEIGWMERWLRDRDQPVPTRRAGDAPEHAHLPGMVTAEQMTELERAGGTAFDRHFLTLMIQHHRGAVAMVLELLAMDGTVQDPATFKLASDIHVDQTTEIARMEQMLAALPSGDMR